MILADMIGPSNLRIKRDTGSTPWLVDLIWATAARLGYANVFVNEDYPVRGDDHFSFIFSSSHLLPFSFFRNVNLSPRPPGSFIRSVTPPSDPAGTRAGPVSHRQAWPPS